jgi:hypothetical protein
VLEGDALQLVLGHEVAAEGLEGGVPVKLTVERQEHYLSGHARQGGDDMRGVLGVEPTERVVHDHGSTHCRAVLKRRDQGERDEVLVASRAPNDLTIRVDDLEAVTVGDAQPDVVRLGRQLAEDVRCRGLDAAAELGPVGVDGVPRRGA